MGFSSACPRLARLVLTCSALVVFATESRGDYSISNNLTGTSGGVESSAGSAWIAAGFGSGTGGQLSSVALALTNFVAGTAEVDIYKDDGLAEPGTVVKALTLSSSYTSGAANPTFTASGITLTANTTYWVVLKALSGTTVNWSWTSANTGTGVGYQNTWGESADAGTTWFTYDSYPTQMNVILASAASVPEPSTWILWGSGAVGLTLIWIKQPARAPINPVVVG